MTGTAPLRAGVLSFAAMLRHDVATGARSWRPFLAQMLLLPLCVLFVFGKLLPELGYLRGDYADILLPGLVAANAFLGALHGIALPLSVEFSWTGEIEDRLLAPLDTNLVALEKVLFAALRGIAGAVAVVPAGFAVLGVPRWGVTAVPAAFGILVLGAFAGAAIGLVLGSLVVPCRMAKVFTVALPPLAFTGGIHFPVRGLDGIPWFRIVCGANPLTYVAEGLRAALLPGGSAIGGTLAAGVLGGVLLAAGLAGALVFHRRAVP